MKQTQEEITYYDESANGHIANQWANRRTESLTWFLVLIVIIIAGFVLGRRFKNWIMICPKCKGTGWIGKSDFICDRCKGGGYGGTV